MCKFSDKILRCCDRQQHEMLTLQTWASATLRRSSPWRTCARSPGSAYSGWFPTFQTASTHHHSGTTVTFTRTWIHSTISVTRGHSNLQGLQHLHSNCKNHFLHMAHLLFLSLFIVELHWLPIHYRIQFKLTLLMYMAHICQSPAYTVDAVMPVSQEPSSNRLLSAATTDFIIPRTRTKLGERAFSVSGPTTWNSRSLWEQSTVLQLLNVN